MSCGPLAPIFWQRQPKLPLPVFKFLGARVHAALASPRDRCLLVWPMVLGAPKLREDHPAGVPEELLLAQAGRILLSLGITEPEAAWDDVMARFPDTADRDAGGWVPQRVWAPLGQLVSLRLGVTLLALQGQPEDDRYGLAAGVALFNSALFHEAHDALEPLWLEAEGPLKAGLQGLIMLAAGFHHHQLHNARGMISLWEDALRLLAEADGMLRTPWGAVGFAAGAASAAERLAWLADYDGERDLTPLWDFSRPTLELL
jgi:hypothetical protein